MKLEFKDVSKTYGSITALNSVDFVVEQGEFVLITGPSGSGKSTILKLILNQVTPTKGQILLDNIDVITAKKNTIDKLRVKIGAIFQDFQLITDKTIEENISLNLDIALWPSVQIPAKVEEVLSQVNLKNRRHLFPSQLSGGELQRTALARALSSEPSIILADEPTGNLDIENSWILLKLLKKINEKNKTTIIMTTHNQDIINSLNCRKIYIRGGEVQLDQKPIKKPLRSTKI